MALILGAVGTAAVVGSMFGSSAKLRAQKQAMYDLQIAREQARTQAKAYEAEFSPFVAMSKDYLGEANTQIGQSQNYLQQLITETNQTDVGQGFSEADTIALKDAQRLLNENLSNTGNLRSGAAAFSGMELARRFVADVRLRQINANMNKLQLLYGAQTAMAQGANQYQSLAGTAGQIGTTGKSLATQLMTAQLGIAPAQANATIGAGNASAEFASTLGSAPLSLASTLQNYESGQADMAQSQAYTKYLQSKTA